MFIISSYAISATYTINSRGQNFNVQQNGCDIPPYSTTVSPYTTNGNCPVPNQQYQTGSQQEVPYQIQQGQYYNQNRQFTGQASTLGELPPGTLVMDPNSVWYYRDGDNYSGEIKFSHPVFWRKLEDNHYTQGATLLLSEYAVAWYPFCHENKGLRAWDESDARRFLRTSFYNHLSPGFKNAIVNVNIPFADMQGNPKTVVDNFFLLSIVEWGLSDRANNGKVIKYYDLPNLYRKHYLYESNVNKIDSVSVFGQTTRTINRPVAKGAGYTLDVFKVQTDGVLDTIYYDSSMGSTSIAPAVNLKSSTRVSGPYQIEFPHDKTTIYYVLDFNQNQSTQYQQQPTNRGY